MNEGTGRLNHFVYGARSVASLVAAHWRLESALLGFRDLDVPIEAVPVGLRKPGTPVWVVWNKSEWRVEAIFPRASPDGSDLPSEWRAVFEAQIDGHRQPT